MKQPCFLFSLKFFSIHDFIFTVMCFLHHWDRKCYQLYCNKNIVIRTETKGLHTRWWVWRAVHCTTIGITNLARRQETPGNLLLRDSLSNMSPDTLSTRLVYMHTYMHTQKAWIYSVRDQVIRIYHILHILVEYIFLQLMFFWLFYWNGRYFLVKKG